MRTLSRTAPAPPAPETVARLTLWLAVAAGAVQTAVGAANELSVESALLNPDEEGSVFQLTSVAVTAAAAAGAAGHALLTPLRRVRFAVLAAALAAFAVDDLRALHERAADAVGGELLGLPDHLAVRLWVVLLLPLLVVVLVLLASEALRTWGLRPGRCLAAGLVALVGAVGVELLGAVTRSPSFVDVAGGKPEAVRLLVEEGLELGGLVLVAGALWAILLADVRRPRPGSVRAAG